MTNTSTLNEAITQQQVNCTVLPNGQSGFTNQPLSKMPEGAQNFPLEVCLAQNDAQLFQMASSTREDILWIQRQQIRTHDLLWSTYISVVIIALAAVISIGAFIRSKKV